MKIISPTTEILILPQIFIYKPPRIPKRIDRLVWYFLKILNRIFQQIVTFFGISLQLQPLQREHRHEIVQLTGVLENNAGLRCNVALQKTQPAAGVECNYGYDD